MGADESGFILIVVVSWLRLPVFEFRGGGFGEKVFVQSLDMARMATMLHS